MSPAARSALTLSALAALVLAVLLPRAAHSVWPAAYCRTAGQGGGGPVPPRCEDVLGAKIPDLHAADRVVFAVMGDMGTGTPAQRAVGAALTSACKTAGCRFAIAVGDNLYDGPTRLDDPRFTTWFKTPYAELDLPVWLALGNHDWYGNPAIEIAYTGISKNDARGPYWFLPGPMYSVPRLPPWLDLVAFDTNSIHDKLLAGVEAQRAWLTRILPRAADPKRWTLLFGHHPYRSSGAHGDELSVEAFLKPWLEKRAIDALFFGHDHHQEHFAADDAELFIQGAGAQIRDRNFDGTGRACASATARGCARWRSLSLGFSIVTATPKALAVDFYVVDAAGKATVAYRWRSG